MYQCENKERNQAMSFGDVLRRRERGRVENRADKKLLKREQELI